MRSVVLITDNVLQISEGKYLETKILTLKQNVIMKTKTSIYRRHFTFAYVLLVAVIFCGCNNPQETNGSEKFDNRKLTNYVAYGKNIQIVEIDSCEYLYSYNFSATWMTHKGNCKFCAERSKK